MALRISNGLRNFILQHGSLRDALQNGRIEIYSGAQPATPDAAVSGTLLATITSSSGSRTAEVLSTGTITVTGTTGGVATATVNSINLIPQGAVAFNTSLNQTAVDLAAAINAGVSNPDYTASATGASAVVTISAKRGTGTVPNGLAVLATYTGDMGGSYANMSGGVAAINGLTMGNAASGVIAKTTSQTWSGVAVASGTMGWFRFYGSVADAGAADAADTTLRLDGSIATSGAQLNMSSTAVTSGATQTVATFAVTQPAA